MKDPLSACCEAPVYTAHGCDADFGHGGKKCNCTMVTAWYECSKCRRPCDIFQDHASFWKSNRAEKIERTKRYVRYVIQKYKNVLIRLAQE